MRLVLLALIVTTGAVGFAFRPEFAASMIFWLGLALPYAVLAGVAIHRMHDAGTLAEKLRFRGGDITVGILLGGALIGGAFMVRQGVAPRGSDEAAWIFRIFMQIGPIQGSVAAAAALVFLAVCEELVWRGMVLGELDDRFGSRWGWMLAAGAYALVHVPSAFTLRDPAAGLNPLLVLAALGGGIVWSFAASRLGRLPPVIVSHAVFTYFTPALLFPRL